MPTTLHPPRAHEAPPAVTRAAPPRGRSHPRRRLAILALTGLVAASLATYALTARPWLPAPGAEPGPPSPLTDVPPLRLGGR